MADKSNTPERKYTEAQEKRIQEFADSQANGLIDSDGAEILATEFGKDVRSVRAKASRMGIYKAKEKQSVNGGEVENKEQIAADITAIVGRNLDSLAKAQKPQLAMLRDFLRSQADALTAYADDESDEPEAIAA